MKGRIGQAYEVFLELPVAMVLAVLWLFGAAVLGAYVLALYVNLYLYASLLGWV